MSRIWIVPALVVAMAIPTLVLLTVRGPEPLTDDLFGGVGGVAFTLLGFASAVVGAAIVARARRNIVGRLLLALAVTTAASDLAYAYATYGVSHGSSLPAMRWAAWFGIGAVTAPLIGLALFYFPDGRLPSPRWRPAAAIMWVPVVLLSAGWPLAAGPLGRPLQSITNPVGIPGGRNVCLAIDRIGWFFTVAGIALAVWAARTRLRRATGTERQQLTLVLSIGAVAGAIIVAGMMTWFVWPTGHLRERMAVVAVAFTLFVIAIGIAMVRYRLYDVDVVIQRTLVYTALSLLLAATYAVTALVLGTALGRGSTWATAGATLAVAFAFRPLRGALQDVVDRRFQRARYDARHRVQAFLEDLRAGRAEPEAIEPLLRELLSDDSLALRFFLPASEVYVDASGVVAEDSPGDGRARTPVVRAGAPLALVLHRPTEELEALVEAGGLAIEITRLRVELRRQLAEVEASRARIVAAGYAERRRIERDLHDGAQQRLVSIGLELRHAQHKLGPPGAMLERAVSELAAAIGELRELAHGLPPSQLDTGLAPALRELAGRAPLPVSVDATAERFSTALEAAAYFVACEGLTNAIKHADASAVVLSAQRRNGTLIVSVTDDGVGGALEAGGSGLSGLRDRVAAHGGSFEIRSGEGTTLIAELPCGS